MLVEDKLGELIESLQVNERMDDDATTAIRYLGEVQMELESIIKKLTRDPSLTRALRNNDLSDTKRSVADIARKLNETVGELNEILGDLETTAGGSGGDAGMGRFARFMR